MYIDNQFFFFFFTVDKSCLTNIQSQLNVLFKITNLKKIFYNLNIEIDIEVENFFLYSK